MKILKVLTIVLFLTLLGVLYSDYQEEYEFGEFGIKKRDFDALRDATPYTPFTMCNYATENCIEVYKIG